MAASARPGRACAAAADEDRRSDPRWQEEEGPEALVDAAVSHALGRQSGAVVPLELDVDDVTLVTDRVRVEQAHANLIANAVSWSSPGETVAVRARQATSGAEPDPCPALEVDVLDRGPGVGPAAMAGLFVPFAGPRDGSSHGLGLAAAAADVRALGGRIGYRDRPGGGAWFWFRVPTPLAARSAVNPPASRAPA